MKEDPYLALNLTITFNLPLYNPKMSLNLLEKLWQVTTSGCLPQESSYLIQEQIEKATRIILSFNPTYEPPDELE